MVPISTAKQIYIKKSIKDRWRRIRTYSVIGKDILIMNRYGLAIGIHIPIVPGL